MTTINPALEIAATTTNAELQGQAEMANSKQRVEAYNQLTGKSIKKFATKATGFRQLCKAMVEHRDSLKQTETKTDEPKPAAKPKAKAKVKSAVASKLDSVAGSSGGAKHDPKKYRDAYVREELLKGRTDYGTLLEECCAKFPNRSNERKHIMWVRWNLEKNGHTLPRPAKTKK